MLYVSPRRERSDWNNMKDTAAPVFRLTPDCIWNAFQSSHKKHLILTGARKSGKSTLLSGLLSGNVLPCPLPGITTWAEPGKAVYLRENSTGETVCIGLYDKTLSGTEKLLADGIYRMSTDVSSGPDAAGNKMRPCEEGFLTLGIAALRRCREAENEYVSLDEIGYLESGCQDYCEEIRRLMACRRVLAVTRKQSLPFLEELCRREDVFLVDLDQPFGRLGCVIMASGLGTRFGGNKLMADFHGKPLIQRALDATEGIFDRRITATRHKEVEKLCRLQGVDVLLHDLPYRSDTVRLGLQAVSGETEGCLFCPGDQPLLRRDTVAALALSAVNDRNAIWRPVWEDTEGAPVLFPKWSFPELLALPLDCGGSFLLKKYPERIRRVPVRDRYELLDVDSRQDLEFLSSLFVLRQQNI